MSRIHWEFEVQSRKVELWNSESGLMKNSDDSEAYEKQISRPDESSLVESSRSNMFECTFKLIKFGLKFPVMNF